MPYKSRNTLNCPILPVGKFSHSLLIFFVISFFIIPLKSFSTYALLTSSGRVLPAFLFLRGTSLLRRGRHLWLGIQP